MYKCEVIVSRQYKLDLTPAEASYLLGLLGEPDARWEGDENKAIESIRTDLFNCIQSAVQRA